MINTKCACVRARRASRNSRLVVPDRPGCGIEWDEKAVRELGYDA